MWRKHRGNRKCTLGRYIEMMGAFLRRDSEWLTIRPARWRIR
jgi:hypothetical protein